MAIQVYCPGCDVLDLVADSQADTVTRCGNCGITFKVPNPFPAAIALPPEPTQVVEPVKPADAATKEILAQLVPPAPTGPAQPTPRPSRRSEKPNAEIPRRRRDAPPPVPPSTSSNLFIILTALVLALFVLLVGLLGLASMRGRNGNPVPVNASRS